MQYSLTLLALAAAVYANPVSYTGASIPACGWTTTLITEAGATDTVPIPLASADCSSSQVAPVSSVPASTTAPPTPECTEYVDGQPQCSSAVESAPACTEYVDGQPQCSSPVSSAPACTEYVDGQPQCSSPVSSAPACTEYVDGQPQCSSVAPTGVYPSTGVAPTGTGVISVSSYAPPQATGAANIYGPGVGLLAAGFAVALM